MTEQKYTFATGKIPPDAKGRSQQVLFILDATTSNRIAYITFDKAAELLLAELNLDHATVREP